jgi:hypothetical protein
VNTTIDWELGYDGYVLRDASLEDIEHYFVYRADEHAALFLGGPGGDEGLRIAA